MFHPNDLQTYSAGGTAFQTGMAESTCRPAETITTLGNPSGSNSFELRHVCKKTSSYSGRSMVNPSVHLLSRIGNGTPGDCSETIPTRHPCRAQRTMCSSMRICCSMKLADQLVSRRPGEDEWAVGQDGRRATTLNHAGNRRSATYPRLPGRILAQ